MLYFYLGGIVMLHNASPTFCDYEEYAQKNLGIPYVNFKDIDLDIIKIILQVLKEAYQKYPLLSSSLISIGMKEDINNQLLLSYCADKYDWQRWQKYETCDYIGNISQSTFVTNSLEKYGNCYYLGLCLCPILKQLGLLDFENYKRINPNGHIEIKNSFLRPAMWHEIGHMLDFIMHISESITFKQIIKNHDIEKEISLYATKNQAEVLAEAFSMYILDNHNPLIKKIGLLVEKEYLRYSKNNLLREKFNVQKYFKKVTR